MGSDTEIGSICFQYEARYVAAKLTESMSPSVGSTDDEVSGFLIEIDITHGTRRNIIEGLVHRTLLTPSFFDVPRSPVGL